MDTQYTISRKIKNVSMLLRYVHENIINNQNIKRMIYYDTTNPLSLRGLTYDGSKIEQPDVTNKQVAEHITLLPFNPKMEMKEQNSIFLNIPMIDFGKNNNYYIEITALVSTRNFEISNGIRLYEISHEIVNLFDGICVEDLSYELGNANFKCEDVIFERLSSNSKMICASIRFKVDLLPFDKTRG